MRKGTLALSLAVSLFAACGTDASFHDLISDPEDFPAGTRAHLSGHIFDPEPIATGHDLLCIGPPQERPQRCIEMAGFSLATTLDEGEHRLGKATIHNEDGWLWTDELDLDCLVVARMPVDANPERVILYCVMEGQRA